MIRDAYDALGRGELAPWIDLLDPAVVWRAVDHAEVGEAPT
jgi:hypothetical protein